MSRNRLTFGQLRANIESPETAAKASVNADCIPGGFDVHLATVSRIRCVQTDVAVVHDRYHLVSATWDTIDSIRREEQRRLEGEDKEVLKGSRYLLLYGEEKLDEQSPEKLAKLDEVLEANETLQKAYILKEKFRRFWEQPSKWAAKVFLLSWIIEALSVLLRHFDRIIAWYDQKNPK